MTLYTNDARHKKDLSFNDAELENSYPYEIRRLTP